MTDVERLRSRLNEILADFGKEFPQEMLARAFIATGCDISLADTGLMSTIWMTERATNLLAGHWSHDLVNTFIETRN